MADRIQIWVLTHQRIAVNLIWLWLALAAVISGAVFLLDPSAVAPSTPVKVLLHPYDILWNLGFMAGGAIKLVGFFTKRLHVEALGMMILTGAIMVSFLATVFVVGFVPVTLSYPALVIAGIARVMILVALARSRRDASPVDQATIDQATIDRAVHEINGQEESH